MPRAAALLDGNRAAAAIPLRQSELEPPLTPGRWSSGGYRRTPVAEKEQCMPATRRLLRFAALVAALGVPLAAAAQAPPATKPPVAAPKVQPPDPSACSDTKGPVAKGNPAGPSPSDKTLSDRLAQSSGVICPPKHVDPEIQAPTPPGGPMPVIPPPGSPGGNPDVKPK
jgi:hypothetical protein